LVRNFVKIEIMKLLVMKFSPYSYYVLPLGPKGSPQHRILRRPQSVLPLMEETKFSTQKQQGEL
jgi:hypothetical protein